jgi:hypothetical protein
MCITDFDGTLLGSDRKVSDANLLTLAELPQHDVIRVLATGRSLWSLKRVIDQSFPLDYVIFATGAGVMNWKTQEMIYTCNLSRADIVRTNSILNSYDVDYMIHYPIPDTHFMHYCTKHGLQDYWDRIDYYRAFSKELTDVDFSAINEATQFMAIAESTQEAVYQELVTALKPLNCIRTTSPIDLKSLWIEIFAEPVSKGRSLKYLADLLDCRIEDAMVIGNDFNDEDMLCLCPNAFVTANAPEELRIKHINVAHHDRDGFSEAVQMWQRNTW